MATLNTLSSYGTGFQIKIINSLLKHKEFLQNINDVLDINMFDSPASKWIVTETLKYYYKYHTTPSIEYMQVEVKKIDNDVLKVSVIEQLKDALKATNDDREYVEQEFSNFCKNQQLKNAILESVKLLESGNWEDIRHIIVNASKAGQDKTLGHEYDKDIETRYRQEERGVIATKWENINQLLAGGLGKGDVGIIFGNPGGGKSTMLVNIGAFAAISGKNVNHYTLELAEDYVGKKYDAIFTGINTQDLHMHKEKVGDAVSKIKGKLIIKEFPMGKATVNNIETHIQKCRDLGNFPDLIIIDYVDLLKSKTRSIDPKDAIDDVYTAVKGMARELKLPIWTVSQVNRCHNISDIVETPLGKIKIGDVKVGDLVLTHKGFKPVTKVYPIEKQPTYKVRLKNGKEINISANHVVPTQYGKLKSIATGLKVGDKLFIKK